MGFITKSNGKQCLRTDRGVFDTVWKDLEADLVQFDIEVMLEARQTIMDQPGDKIESQGDGAYPQTGRQAQAVVVSILAKHNSSGRFLRVAHCILKRSAELNLEKENIKGNFLLT